MSGIETVDAQGRPVGGPWYRYFWPWFIVGLLGISVAGSLLTVAIAVDGADPDVRPAEAAAEAEAKASEAD
jgi:hypothetical protein